MTLALVEEERQVNHLKALLRNASDRIEYEIRRADEAEARADYAEQRAKDVAASVAAAEAAKRQAEVLAEQASSENRRYQMQLESVEQELKRLRADVQRLEKNEDELEESNKRAKETSRQYQTALQNFQAREEGREEVRHLAIERAYNKGREEGWNLGHEEGFDEGREEGYDEGRRAGRKGGMREGREQGRNEERRNALEAFDRFLNEEMNEYDDGVSRLWNVLKSIHVLIEIFSGARGFEDGQNQYTIVILSRGPSPGLHVDSHPAGGRMKACSLLYLHTRKFISRGLTNGNNKWPLLLVDSG